MKVTDLDFAFPEELIALSPSRPSRVMLVKGPNPVEISIEELLAEFNPGDLLVINDTKVLKRRVFAGNLEILFLDEIEPQVWRVLFPAKGVKLGAKIDLPEGIQMQLLEKGIPQKVNVSVPLSEQYFEKYGELPLPPYIQKARQQRHQIESDQSWYQTAWAKKPGSLAAPTASLHFTEKHLDLLKSKGVEVLTITLNVGLGTFLPIHANDLSEHQMHYEEVEISRAVWQRIQSVKAEAAQRKSSYPKPRVWALGTTVARSLESLSLGMLKEQQDYFRGQTNLFIYPPFEFKVVDVLMTNFHQPGSTLLALVSAFTDIEKVKACYQWAIEKKFKLFSYGDLTVWMK